MWCIFQGRKNERKIHLSSSKLQPWLKQSSCSSPWDCLRKGDFLLLRTGFHHLLNKPLPPSLAKKIPSSRILQRRSKALWTGHCLAQQSRPHPPSVCRDQSIKEPSSRCRGTERGDVPVDLISPFLLSLPSVP